MTILKEMRDFLGKHIEDSLENKARDIELICNYYGFGDNARPTQQEIAEGVKDFNTRSRAQQIIAKHFGSAVSRADIPSALRLRDTITSQRYWVASKFEEVVFRAGIAGGPFNLPGMLDLLRLKGLSLNHGYWGYTLDLKRVTKHSSKGDAEHFLLRDEDVPRFRALLQQARKFPVRKGIARFEDLVATHDDFATYSNLLREIILHHRDVWRCQRDDGLWYLFEGRENSLINHVRKALTKFDKCDLTKLAESIYKALDDDRKEHRSQFGDALLPSVDLIEDYLRTSRFFVAKENVLYSSLSSFERKEVIGAEKDLVEYIRAHQGISFKDATGFLSSKGRTRSTTSKTLSSSPLIYVDKALDQRPHIYRTVEWSDSDELKEQSTEDRYSSFSKRLQQLSKTDIVSEQQSRGEQDILRDWLFENKETEECALCAQRFSVKALVAAHKKRRADECNEGERRDPYIVMPLCKFGCDYLYEERHVYVEDGVVRRNPKVPLQVDGVERAHVDSLVGREMEERWLEGPSSYFYRPTE